MAKKPIPSQQTLRQLLHYDPNTGCLTWLPRSESMFSTDSRLTARKKADAWNGRNAGRRAFTASDGKGYLQGAVAKYHTTAHRVAFAWMHGMWPSCIDHINGDKTDNRACNLRAVSRADNARNSAIPVSNTSGAIGVRLHGRTGRWEAHIGSGPSYQFIGSYGCKTAAAIARKAAQITAGYHANHGRRASGMGQQV